MYLRQVDLYDSIIKANEKLLTTQENKYEKLIAAKEERLAANNKIITLLYQKLNTITTDPTVREKSKPTNFFMIVKLFELDAT